MGAGVGAGAGSVEQDALREAAAMDVLYGLDAMSVKMADAEHSKGVSTGVRRHARVSFNGVYGGVSDAARACVWWAGLCAFVGAWGVSVSCGGRSELRRTPGPARSHQPVQPC